MRRLTDDISRLYKTIAATSGLVLASMPAFAQQWISAPSSEGSLPIFTKTFRLPKAVSKATIHSSAMGVYTLTVNGHEIDHEELKPGWTEYRKEIFYQTNEMPSSLTQGDSLHITAQVSNGWWIGGITRGVYGENNKHAFICWIDVDYADGASDTLATDTTWLCSTDGPLLLGDIYNGETYDARRRPSRWESAVINHDAKGQLVPAFGPKVTIRDKSLWREPTKLTVYEGSVPTGTTYGRINVVASEGESAFPVNLKKGQTLLVDFGQNMVGWVDFTVNGQSGTWLTCSFGEMLNYNGDAARLDKGPAGSLWNYNLREAKATIRYALCGDRDETFHPRHSFFGFRYAELTATDDISINRIAGQVVGSDIKEWGTFSCSNDDINKLYSNVWWGQRGNFLSIPTDCPQRDERLGWTGDTQIFSITALYNSDTKDFYRKWMRDMRNSQREDGAYPCTAPAANMWGYGGSAWGDAGVIVPWNVYVMTGDTAILSENYDSMVGWMDYCAHFSEGEWTHVGAETHFGDWLAYKEVEKRYVSYAYFAHTSHLMSKIATLLGRHADADRFRKLHEAVIEEFQLRYVKDGRITEGQDTQTAYLLALHFNLLREDQRPYAMQCLRRNIEANGCRLSTGFVGTGVLMETLTECGMTDLAYSLLLQRENPSWLYSIDQGATTVWERWDSYTKADGFHKHHWNMNSFNHYSYGAVAGWFYSTILGIRPDEAAPGFKHIVLEPHPGGGLAWAEGSTMTPYGPVSVRWEKTGDATYRYEVEAPKHTRVTLITAGKKSSFKGNGRKKVFRIADN